MSVISNELLNNGFLGSNLKYKYEDIQKLAYRVIHFVEEHNEFLNCHMVDFITENHFKNLLKTEVHDEICKIISHEDIENFILGNNLTHNEKFQNFSGMVGEINSLHIRNISSEMKLFEEGQNVDLGDVQKMWISQKKYYETNLMANLIANISKLREINVIVDFGCGKGYLPSLLALKHELSVFGIDSSDKNKRSAEKRNTDFKKEFLKRNRNAKNISKGQFTPYKENITNSTNIQKLVTDNMKKDNPDPNLLLCGLHTCGNLGSDIAHHFVKAKNARILCYVGCCYHLIEEKYHKDPKFNESKAESESSFPISNLLSSRRVKLGRNARMLGCQSFERNVIEDKSHTVFHRALLEVILRDHNYTNKRGLQVGRISGKCPNFEAYVYKAFDRLELTHLKDMVTKENIEQYLTDYALWKVKLKLFQHVRILMGSVVETIIVLDRLLYLIEQESISNCHLLQVFDPVKSPRCYCIVAIK